jgi:hypothetical protein
LIVGILLLLDMTSQNAISQATDDVDGNCDHMESLQRQLTSWGRLSILLLFSESVCMWLVYYNVVILRVEENDSALKSTRMMYSYLVVMGVFFFVWGNIVILSKREYIVCGWSQSALYKGCLAILINQYVHYIGPVFGLVLLHCCCLPSAIIEPLPDDNQTAEMIKNLPVVIHNDSSISSEKNPCPICISGFKIGDKLRVLPCKHRFHIHCVDNWLIQNATCPNCRSRIETSTVPSQRRPVGNTGQPPLQRRIEREPITNTVLPLS